MRDEYAEDPRWRCLLPAQWMPLPKCSPDLHAIAEHGVGTGKSVVAHLAVEATPDEYHKGIYGPARLQDVDAAFPGWGLLTTKPWQDAIVQAFDKLNADNRWLHEVKRGVDRMLCLATVLNTPAGQPVTVHYNFTKDDSDLPLAQRAVVEAVGSDGQWQSDTRLSG